jgi:hypothetical protein
MTLRSSGRLSPSLMQNSLQTPVSDTHHRFEFSGRAGILSCQ